MNENSPRSEKSFWYLVALQAQGAFSDNAFKSILLLYVSFLVVGEGASQQGFYNGLLTAFFPATFLMFSCWAGFLADRYSKRTVTVAVKLAEIVTMSLGLLVFWAAAGSSQAHYGVFVLSAAVLFLMCTHSAFFNPSKYGIIPELVREDRLGWANGLIGLTTNLAIILGLAATPELFRIWGMGGIYKISIILVLLSCGGFLLSLGIERLPVANPGRPVRLNFLPELMQYFRIINGNRSLLLVVLGLSYFWAMGAMVTANLNVWGEYSLGFSQVGAMRLNWVLALGIAAGSGLAGAVSRRRIEPGLIPLSALGIGLFALPLAMAVPSLRWLMVIDLALLGAAAGSFLVPLNAMMQQRTGLRDRGGLLAAANYYTETSMLTAMIVSMALNGIFKVPPNGIFLFIGVVTLVGTVVIVRLMPESLLRMLNLVFTKIFYRIQVIGLDRLPAEGGALLVSNHVSFIDALLIQSVSPRPIRFIVHEDIYKGRIVGFFLKIMKAIPVGGQQRPRELLRSLKSAAEVMASGELVCIFAEGQITRTGMLLPFKRGYELILKEAPAPIVPVCLNGLWGSIFSFESGRFFFKRPTQIPYPVRIAFGDPLPAETPAHALRQRIEELGAEASIGASGEIALVSHRLVRNARRYWRRLAMSDLLSPPITAGQVLWRSVILARRLAKVWKDQQTVGILLPPSVGGALANYAVALSGRTAVNLNYTTGPAVLKSCMAQAEIKTVVTSRVFLEKVGLECPAEPVYIEEWRGYRGMAEVITAILAARFLPIRLLERFCGAREPVRPETPAAIIFSSGSTGEPKGVPLTHFNIASNIESFKQGIHIWPSDCLLGVLPFFHSFGYTVALWGSVGLPFRVVFHYNPLDVKTIGELCQKQRVTVIVTTPTFLQQYMRRLDPAQLGSVNCVITGAEKLTDSLSAAFAERFGVEPLQGYGTTECSPVVSVNVNDHRSPGIYQVGHKRGSIGHPLPGVAAQIRGIETGEPVGPGETGLLWVRGPNVMAGYLGLPEKTAEVLRDGWYNTGDVAYIDEDGFIFITDRLSRFSKIGGEMVPHVTVEDRLREALAMGPEEGLVVTAVPDSAKGERLVVLHTVDEKRLDGVAERLVALGLPNLWVPRREMYFRIEAVPLLGSGKLDLQAVKKLAASLTAVSDTQNN